MKLRLGFVTDIEKMAVEDLSFYDINENEKVIMLNRIIHFSNPKKATLRIVGTTKKDHEFTVERVQAECINFSDISK